MQIQNTRNHKVPTSLKGSHNKDKSGYLVDFIY